MAMNGRFSTMKKDSSGVLKDNDHDSRVEDMCKICASLDNRNHATFSKIKCVANM